MPQKSVDPVPTLSSTTSTGPAASNSPSIPARPGIEPVALAVGLERFEGGLGLFAPRLSLASRARMRRPAFLSARAR